MSLQLQSFASNNSIWSIQDILFSYQSPDLVVNGVHAIKLFSDGCSVDGHPKRCREACSDPTEIFNGTSTLHNCLVLPVIASAFSKHQLDNESLVIAADYGFDPNDGRFARKVTQNIQQCLSDYCSDKSGCGGTICDGLSQDQCYNHTNICDSIYAPVMDDIAGVGVSHGAFGIIQPCQG